MFTYWPWWQGALALGAIPIVFRLLLGKPLGVSGSWGQIMGWRGIKRVQVADAAFRHNPMVMQDALMAATLKQFGKELAMQTMAVPAPAKVRPVVKARGVAARVPVTAHLTFLVSLALGGFLSLLPGSIEMHLTLGPTYAGLFGTNWLSWTVLLFGGTLVGFGTQMAGGCTSGHGLSGCAYLLPASWLATATFFASAVGTSWLLEVIYR